MGRPLERFTLDDKQRALIEDNILLFYKCFNKLKKKYELLSEEEIYDCCVDAAIRSAYKLDEEKGRYSTLFFTAAEKNVFKQMRYWNSKKRGNSKRNISLEYEYESEKDGSKDRFDNTYLGIEDDYDWIEKDETERLFSVLTEKEKDIITKVFFLDMKRSEVGKQYGISKTGVTYHVNVAKRKMRDAYYENQS